MEAGRVSHSFFFKLLSFVRKFHVNVSLQAMSLTSVIPTTYTGASYPASGCGIESATGFIPPREGKCDKSTVGLRILWELDWPGYNGLSFHLQCCHPIWFKSWLLHLWSNFLLMHLGKQGNMTQVFGSLHSHGRPRQSSSFLASACLSATCYGQLWSELAEDWSCPVSPAVITWSF